MLPCAHATELTNASCRTITIDAVRGLGWRISRRTEATGFPPAAASNSAGVLESVGLHNERGPGAMLPSRFFDDDILNDKSSAGSPAGGNVNTTCPIVASLQAPPLDWAAAPTGRDKSTTSATNEVSNDERTCEGVRGSAGGDLSAGCVISATTL